MDLTENPFVAAPNASTKYGQNVRSPDVPPGLNLSETEVKLFGYACEALRGAGIEHFTAGMSLAIAVRTFNDWMCAWEKCQKDGWYQVSPKTGWSAPTAWAEAEKQKKMELGQWLAKCCLTAPSAIRAKKESGASSAQDELFGDLVAHGQSSPGPGLSH